MKKINILLLSLLFSNTFAQEITEKEVKTEVNEVTVFIDNAQITRKKTIDLLPGTTLLKFINLSPFIDSKSVQVKAKGDVTVLSVNHQQNYIDKSTKPLELTNLEAKCKEIDEKINLENTYLTIIQEDLAFLKENRDISGKNQETSIVNLKAASDFYNLKLTELKLKEIERNRTLAELTRQKNDLENQMKTITNKKDFPTGEILVKVNASKTMQAIFEISYITANTGWFPSYDIRATNINEPVVLTYKANVRQDTKEDWKNVKLRFSSTNPNLSGVAPELKTYFLNYNTLPPTYHREINMVKGRVTDQSNTPLSGVSITVPGSTIGAVTDANGQYSIIIPNNADNLNFSYIGYNFETIPITNSQMNVALTENTQKLDEVIVVGYGSAKKNKISGFFNSSAPGLSVQNKELKLKDKSSLAIPLTKVEKQTTVDFEIKTPYTVRSDNKNYSIDMEIYNLPAQYKYYCAPKIDKDAFLIANIVDWEKYNLLDGEANIFFEDTYVGKTLLDMESATDTLSISLGRDKNVTVNRQKIKEYTTKQFIGSKKEETRDWFITVKNNKNQTINMILLDQIPVSTSEEIEIEVQKISSAQKNNETGEIKWEFTLDPSNKKDFELKYSIKYPKNKSLIIE
jgi:hypothetical protein